MPVTEETRRKLRETRQATLARGVTREEAHADLPVLPPVPTEPEQVVAIGVQRQPPPQEEDGT